MIQFSCPRCGQLMTAAPQFVSRRVACARCGQHLIVPHVPPPILPARGTAVATLVPVAEPVKAELPETTLYAEPAPAEPPPLPALNQEPAKKRRSGFQCPICGSAGIPDRKSRISTTGWIVFVVLAFLFFPLCWIGLWITETYLECSTCGAPLPNASHVNLNIRLD